MSFVNADTIIQKLQNDSKLGFEEKAYIERAIKVAEYSESLLNQAIGVTQNVDNLKFLEK